MTTWFVRPDTSHSGTRDGTSYATALGGWTEIQWGAGKVDVGDTLYICGAHTYTFVIALGVTGLNVRGDYVTQAGSLSFTNPGVYFNVNRSSTTVEYLTITSQDRCIVPSGAPITGLTIRNCVFNGSNIPAIDLFPLNTWGWVNTVIENNIFNGGTGGGGAAAIGWWPQSPVNTYIENMKITNNVFNGCSAQHGVVILQSHPNALGPVGSPSGVHIYDLEVSNNTFTNCGGAAVKVYVPEYGRNKGVKIVRNTITNQTRLGELGGGIVVGGFVQSTTTDFGPNVIEYNVADGLEGTSGFGNIMYGSYIIRYNVAKNISSIIYDGCGLLFDHGADGCEAYGNYFENLSGPADLTAGAGIGVVFEATNITCYGNVIKNCYVGVLYGNQTSGRVSNIFNNTFIDCHLAAIYGNPTTVPGDQNWCQNNIFTAKTSSAISVRYDSGAWARETNNVFYGFSTGSQALHSSDLTVNPNLTTDFRTNVPQIKQAGTYLGGKDYYSKYFYNPPTPGAVEIRNPNARYSFRR